MIKIKVVAHANAFSEDAEMYDSGLIHFHKSGRWSHIQKELAQGKTVYSKKDEPVIETPVVEPSQESAKMAFVDKPKKLRKTKDVARA